MEDRIHIFLGLRSLRLWRSRKHQRGILFNSCEETFKVERPISNEIRGESKLAKLDLSEKTSRVEYKLSHNV